MFMGLDNGLCKVRIMVKGFQTFLLSLVSIGFVHEGVNGFVHEGVHEGVGGRGRDEMVRPPSYDRGLVRVLPVRRVPPKSIPNFRGPDLDFCWPPCGGVFFWDCFESTSGLVLGVLLPPPRYV